MKKNDIGERIFAPGVSVSIDTRRTGLNNNDLIIGGSGSGKTGGYIYNLLLNPYGSMIVSDTKGLLHRIFAEHVGKKMSDSEEDCLYISPLFIHPKYQNQGIGYVAIQKAFLLYPNAKVWKLDTIFQEPGNCHLYEKCGFV